MAFISSLIEDARTSAREPRYCFVFTSAMWSSLPVDIRARAREGFEKLREAKTFLLTSVLGLTMPHLPLNANQMDVARGTQVLTALCAFMRDEFRVPPALLQAQ